MSTPSRLLLLALVASAATLTLTATAGSQRLSPQGAMHLTMNIRPLGADETTLPANIAVRAGGTVTITFRNYTHRAHTFTIRALGIAALIRPAREGENVAVSHVTFVAPYGVYTWRCLFCATSMHPGTHSMHGKMYAIINA